MVLSILAQSSNFCSRWIRREAYRNKYLSCLFFFLFFFVFCFSSSSRCCYSTSIPFSSFCASAAVIGAFEASSNSRFSHPGRIAAGLFTRSNYFLSSWVQHCPMAESHFTFGFEICANSQCKPAVVARVAGLEPTASWVVGRSRFVDWQMLLWLDEVWRRGAAQTKRKTVDGICNTVMSQTKDLPLAVRRLIPRCLFLPFPVLLWHGSSLRSQLSVAVHSIEILIRKSSFHRSVRPCAMGRFVKSPFVNASFF